MQPTRNDPFVPLTSTVHTGMEHADFRVTVVSQAQNVQPFQPLGQERPAPPATPAPPIPQREPQIEVQRDGDRISSIRIECGCGQILELTCVYDTPQPAEPKPAEPTLTVDWKTLLAKSEPQAQASPETAAAPAPAEATPAPAPPAAPVARPKKAKR